MLTAGGQGIFEAVPVRNGTQKAAQLGRRSINDQLGEGIAMMDNRTKKMRANLRSCICHRRRGCAGQGRGQRLAARSDGGAEPPRATAAGTFRLSVDGALRGECFVEFYEPQITTLAGEDPRPPPVDDEA